ncbi:MAG: uridine kinase [Pseudonocardiales bacterium]|jgi:uridine kinase|nr:uridine kinase [Pseudonocardiales bacterium]
MTPLSQPAPTVRSRLIELVAGLVPSPHGADCVRIGIDGVDGAGKTCLADELAHALRTAGRPVVRVRVDDFHQVRAIRYRRGRGSPSGFWLDSFDYPRLWAEVLEPLGPGGSRRYRPAGHDLETDQLLHPPLRTAPAGAVLVLDGVFLHRPELAGAWELSIFLDAGFDETARRMAGRDGSAPDPEHPSLARYVLAQRRYLAGRPWQRADVVIDNAVLAAPVLVSLIPRREPDPVA